MRKKIIYTLWSLLVVGIIATALTFTAIWNGWIGYMPDMEALQNPIDKYASQIISEDGKTLGTWSRSSDNRIQTHYQDISVHVVQALVATEDARFYEHSGIDFISLLRAIVKRGIFGQESAGGGSTISQQLAKQLYTEKAHSTLERVMQKPIEWVIAVKLERNFTKEEIIAMYLNKFDFLHNAVGIKTAAMTYFGKGPKDLTITEAALLVGLCKNPSYFNPVRHEERCLERRNVVLSQMRKEGYISDADYEKHSAEPIKLNFRRNDHKDGSATYLREYLRRYMTATKPIRSEYQSWQKVQFVIDSIAWEQDPLYGWCNKNKNKEGRNYDIYEDGLKIYTTINSRMQQYAEDAVYEHVAQYLQPAFDKENRRKPNAPFTSQLSKTEIQKILNRSVNQSDRYRNMKKEGFSEEEIHKAFNTPTEMTIFSYRGEIDTTMTPLDSIRYYKSFLRSGFMSMDPKTGMVKAYVGGLNYEHFQYDMAADGRRQVGSTIKPFVYAAGFEECGFSPKTEVLNAPRTYYEAGQPWTPRNSSNRRIGEMVTLEWGLAQSNNWVTAYVMNEANPLAFVGYLQRFGFQNPDIHPSMALCLGPCDFTVCEMVSAYTTFANHGIRCAPMFVTRIEDNEGNVIARFEPRMTEVISEESAYKMLVLLQGVVDGGTGGRLRFKYNVRAQMGGKTGTTNRNSDAWFMAVAPSLVSGCWVGGEDRDIHFDYMFYGQGASMALPIYAYYIQKVYKDESLPYSEKDTFDVPHGYDACASSGKSDASESGPSVEDVFE